MSREKEIWVLCEIRGSELLEVGLELIGKAASMAPGSEWSVCAVLLGHDSALYAEKLFAAGADVVIPVCCEKGAMPPEHIAAERLYQMLKDNPPFALLIGAGVYGRTLAPLLAARLKTGLTADCTELSIENGLLVQTRPAFGGTLMAEVICPEGRPQMASVRPGAFPLPNLKRERHGTVRQEPCSSEISSSGIRILGKKAFSSKESLLKADIILAGGAGLGKEGFKKLREIGDKTNCSIGASRSAVNMGLAPFSAQIGQTGMIVRPKFYIAIGISGSVQHLVGIRNAGAVMAVNPDPRAPIFRYADIGVVSGWEDFLPKLEDALLSSSY